MKQDDAPKPLTHLATFTPDEVRRMILESLATVKGIAVPFGTGARCTMNVEFFGDGEMRVAVTFYEGKKAMTLRVIQGGKGGGAAG